MTPQPCFICNSCTKLKKQGKAKNVEASSTSFVGSPNPTELKAIYKLWKLPFDLDPEDKGPRLVSCRECSKKVKLVCKALQQLESLRLVLFKLKVEIEETIRKTLVIVDGSSNKNGGDEGLNLLRNQIVGSSSVQVLKDSKEPAYKDDTFTTTPVITAKKSVAEVVDSNYDTTSDASVLEDPFWRETLLSFAGESCGEIVCHPLNEPKSIDNAGKSDGESSIIEDQLSTPDDNCCEKNDDGEVDNLMDFQSESGEADSVDYTSNRLKCFKCRYTFKDEVGRKAHVKKFHEGSDYPYVCSDCDKMFKTRRQFQIHVMGHTNETPFICEHCGKGFRAETLLGFHIQNKHTDGDGEFKCNDCKKGFSTKTKLKIHGITHSKEYPVSCSICGKGFSGKTALNIHMVKHSTGVNPWQCQVCDKYFSCASALKSHQAILHTQQYKFKCSVDLCPFGAPSASALDRHMLSHGTEKGFQCSICSNTFKYNRSLQKHLQAHAGEKKFQCSLCDKKFIDKYKLLRHTKIHEGNKPFECQLCQKRFYTNDYLNSHMKYHEKQAAKEQEASLKLKKAKRAKRRNKQLKKAREALVCQVALPETAQEIITSLTNEEASVFPAITSPDIFSGVFEFTYQDI